MITFALCLEKHVRARCVHICVCVCVCVWCPVLASFFVCQKTTMAFPIPPRNSRLWSAHTHFCRPDTRRLVLSGTFTSLTWRHKDIHTRSLMVLLALLLLVPTVPVVVVMVVVTAEKGLDLKRLGTRLKFGLANRKSGSACTLRTTAASRNWM